MAEQYLGIPGNVAFPSAGTVTFASNANPIVITVSGTLPPQTQISGTTFPVTITGIQGNNAANGQFTATPTGPSTFTIPVAGSGAYTSGGSVSYLFAQSTQIPDDSDDDDAASVNVSLEALSDQSVLLLGVQGVYKLFAVFNSSNTDDTNAVWSSVDALTASTWTANTQSTSWEVDGLINGDLILVSFDGSATFDGSITAASRRSCIMYSATPPGGSPSYARMPGSAVTLFDATVSTGPWPVHMSAHFPVSSNQNSITFLLGSYSSTTSGYTNWVGDYTFTVYVFRATGIRQ